MREHRSECESSGRLSLEVREREQKSHTFLGLLFGDFDHSRQTVAQNSPVVVAESEHAGTVEAVLVREGQEVDLGAVLARVRTA